MLFAVTARYTQQAMQAMIRNPTDREAKARALAEKLGGKLLSWYGMPSASADGGFGFMIIYDVPTEAHFSLLAASTATGVFEDVKSHRLMSPGEFHQAIKDAAGVLDAFESPLNK